MNNTYQIYLISDSTGETLDRIFLALKAQFLNIEYKVHSYSFTRTENQILKILEDAKKNTNSIILYTIVDNSLAKYLANASEDKNIPCFGVLGNLILNFSKILNQKATHEPSGQHILNEEYYNRIEAIQFTMNHDDGNLISEVDKSDIILVGVSRTSKTPTSIYLANKGFKTSNIPLVNENSLPETLKLLRPGGQLMPSAYIPSTRPKYEPLPGSDLRQINIKVRPDAWAALLRLKAASGHQGSVGAFMRCLVTAALKEAEEGQS